MCRHMKNKILFFLILLSFLCAPLMAQAKTHHYKHAKHHKHLKSTKHTKHTKTLNYNKTSRIDENSGYSDIIINAKTGEVLHASNANELRYPASLTKMMTLYMIFQALQDENLRLNQMLPVSTNAAKQQPSKLGLHAGQYIRVRDAILGLITESANDVSVVIAEKLGGTEKNFAHLMTQQARALGMMHTQFDNPSGLPDKRQVTTAHDMAILAQKLIYHFPQFYTYFSNATFNYRGVTYHNHNHLMSHYAGMDGIKTGYIRASGYNLVASVVRGNIRLIGVIFGGYSFKKRDHQMATLLNNAFDKEKQAPTQE